MMGKCPKCDKQVHRVNLHTVEGSAGIGSSTWKCVTYSCPSCHAVLSVQIDPIAIKTDTVRQIKG